MHVPARRRQEADVVRAEAKILNDPHVSLKPDHVAGHYLLEAQLEDLLNGCRLSGHPRGLFPFCGSAKPRAGARAV
jgi:hypothetical protein